MLNNVQLWIDKWQLSLNFNKCVSVSYGHHIDNSHSYLLHRHGSDMVIKKQNLLTYLLTYLNTTGKQNYQEPGVEAELNFEFFESFHFIF